MLLNPQLQTLNDDITCQFKDDFTSIQSIRNEINMCQSTLKSNLTIPQRIQEQNYLNILKKDLLRIEKELFTKLYNAYSNVGVPTAIDL